MARSVQQRTLQTRARLLAVASECLEETGYAALRVEEVASRAGVAKGTFFAHFRDKETLLDTLLGDRLGASLDLLEASPPPRDIAAMVSAMAPLIALIGEERTVFDLVCRRFGTAVDGVPTPIAKAFERLGRLLGGWLYIRAFRKDVPIDIQVEGVVGLILHALALDFSAAATGRPPPDRLGDYLRAWLNAAS